MALLDSNLGISKKTQEDKNVLSSTNEWMTKKSKGSDYTFLFSTCETVSGVQCKILDPSVNQSHWLIGASSGRQSAVWSGAGELLL